MKTLVESILSSNGAGVDIVQRWIDNNSKDNITDMRGHDVVVSTKNGIVKLNSGLLNLKPDVTELPDYIKRFEGNGQTTICCSFDLFLNNIDKFSNIESISVSPKENYTWKNCDILLDAKMFNIAGEIIGIKNVKITINPDNISNSSKPFISFIGSDNIDIKDIQELTIRPSKKIQYLDTTSDIVNTTISIVDTKAGNKINKLLLKYRDDDERLNDELNNIFKNINVRYIRVTRTKKLEHNPLDNKWYPFRS